MIRRCEDHRAEGEGFHGAHANLHVLRAGPGHHPGAPEGVIGPSVTGDGFATDE